MSEKKPCDCNSCKLEAKIADVLEGQATSDGLPALTASLAEVIVQHADGIEEVGALLKHTVDRLVYFTSQATTREVMRQEPDKIKLDIERMLSRIAGATKKADEKPSPLADLPTDLPEEFKSMLKSLVADGAQIKVVKIN